MKNIWIGLILMGVFGMAEARELKEYRWQQRLVVGVVDDSKFVTKLKQEIASQAADIQERKLVFWVYSKNAGWIAEEEPSDDRAMLEEIRRRLGKSDLALIGLDGGTKDRFTKQDFSLERIFDLIDQMPMRREEMDSDQ